MTWIYDPVVNDDAVGAGGLDDGSFRDCEGMAVAECSLASISLWNSSPSPTPGSTHSLSAPY